MDITWYRLTSATTVAGETLLNMAFRRIFGVAIGTLIVSMTLGIGSKLFLSSLGLGLSALVLLTIVSIGIIFDIVGTAVTAADEKPFHAMAAKRVSGARQAIKLVRSADKVANFCNDMVGDICGTISGAVGASIVFVMVSKHPSFSEPLLSAFVVALVASLTVSGKALGKGYAIGQADKIIFTVGQVLAWVQRTLGLRILSEGHRNVRQSSKPNKTREGESLNGKTPRHNR